MGGPGSGAKPKVDDPQLVEQVARLYRDGLTQKEIAAVVGLTQKVIFRVMRTNGITPRAAAKRNQSGSLNHAWKGSAAGYQALHLRVAAARGTPSQCSRCGRSDSGIVYEWANLTGRYDDVNDFVRLCRSCHRKYDNSR